METEKLNIKLTASHFRALKSAKGGCTFYGIIDARLLREVQKVHPEYIDIIDNMDELESILGKKFDNPKEKLPYFGAILLAPGIEALKKFNKTNKKDLTF